MEHEAARTAIAAVLGAVQERWGVHSLTRGYTSTRGSGALASRAGRAAAAPSLPPWWPNAPGYLRPNILELSGPASCGKLGIALLWLAAASRGGLVAVVDLEGSFYPPAAAASGLDLERLVVVRPPDRRAAAETVSLLVSSAGFDAVLWPVAWKDRPRGLDSVRLSTLAARAQTTLLALVTDHRRVTAEGEGEHAAHLFPSADARLRVTGWEWIWRNGELAGVRTRVRTERLRGAMPGQAWELRLEQHSTGDLAMSPDELAAELAAGGEARTGADLWAGADGDTASAAGLTGGTNSTGAAHKADRKGQFGSGGCPQTDHLCLAAALPLGGGGARAAGPVGAAGGSVRPDSPPAPATRTA